MSGFTSYRLHVFAGSDPSSDAGQFVILVLASTEQQALREAKLHLREKGRRDLFRVVEHIDTTELPVPGAIWSNVDEGDDYGSSTHDWIERNAWDFGGST